LMKFCIPNYLNYSASYVDDADRVPQLLKGVAFLHRYGPIWPQSRHFPIAISHHSVHTSNRERVQPVWSGRQDFVAGRGRVKTGRKRRVFPP
jgi:hypothetical protein